ncbi:hypothetical protein GR160_18545 [Flavobacterium sp. Sd200]|uniref:hypothetical protein n=1 Tax=Flavobacterium sp. Sd200 TaxID=2692211 RepID=UPI00136BE3D1|nr:hypothetical protein [Flavobacterium sp. Sd200]MXN93233.1 hypothetical protein [Flavobacterium sp. Sd200]
MIVNNEVRKIIQREENNLKNIISPSAAIGIIYNVIQLKLLYDNEPNIYVLFKKLIENYIRVINSADYGYDDFNNDKIEDLLKKLTYEQQLSILQFTLSRITHELPEYDKTWFLKRKNIAEIHLILSDKSVSKFYKIIPLFAGLNAYALMFTLGFIFSIVYAITYPIQNPPYAIFEIQYENYSSSQLSNHLLNLLSAFVDIDNDFKVIPLNGYAAAIKIICKFFFLLIIANYFYIKVTDKLTT